MSIVFKGTDLKQQFVVVKYKYKKRFFLPRYGDKDSDSYRKAEMFKSVEDAQKAIQERRGNRLKRHKYKIECAENYFGYKEWNFYLDNGQIGLNNETQAVERTMKLDQKTLFTKAKDSFDKEITESLSWKINRMKEKQTEIINLQTEIDKMSKIRDDLRSIDVNTLAEQYKTKSEDMAAILFTGKDEY